MPNFDKTGPQGKGPMTGRGMGPCNLVRGGGMMNGLGRRGRGRGMGMGMGMGRRFRGGSNLKANISQ